MPTQVASESKKLAAGSYPARIYGVVLYGTHEEEFQGKKKDVKKCSITFEFPTKKDVFFEGEEPRPYAITLDFTASFGEKANLYKFFIAMSGGKTEKYKNQAVDIRKFNGMTGLASVIIGTSKKGNKFNDITSCIPLPEGMVCPPLVNKQYNFDIDDFIVNPNDPAQIKAIMEVPFWIRKKIFTSAEFIGKGLSALNYCNEEEKKKISPSSAAPQNNFEEGPTEGGFPESPSEAPEW